MNRTSKDRITQTFSLAYNAGMRFDAQVNAVFSRYRSAKEQARSRASQFKDEESEYKRSMETPTAEARAELKKADEEFADTIKNTVVPRLREILTDHVTAQPPATYLDTLRIYREFGLRPSKMELQTLLHASEGNYIALRALQTVAKDAGYNIKIDDVTEYEKDVELLERLARIPSCYAPLSYTKECDEIFPEVPVFRPDGSVAYNTTASSIRSILTAQEYSSGWKKIREAQERWGTAIVPTIEQYTAKKNEDGEVISPGEQRNADVDAAAKIVDVDNDPEMYGKAIGQRRAAEAEESARVLSHYISKPGGTV